MAKEIILPGIIQEIEFATPADVNAVNVLAGQNQTSATTNATAIAAIDEVEANPTGTASGTLTTVGIGETIYRLPSSTDCDDCAQIATNKTDIAALKTEVAAIDPDQNGTNNFGLGDNTLGNAGTGARDNTGVGGETLSSLTSGDYNMGIGSNVLPLITTASSNMGIGNSSFRKLTSGTKNVGVGNGTFFDSTSATNSTAIGYRAGDNIKTVSDTVIIGKEPTTGLTHSSPNVTNSIIIGKGGPVSADKDFSNKLWIGNSKSATPLISGDFAAEKVTINSTLQVEEEILMKSPDGSLWQIKITNAGAMTIVAVE